MPGSRAERDHLAQYPDELRGHLPGGAEPVPWLLGCRPAQEAIEGLVLAEYRQLVGAVQGRVVGEIEDRGQHREGSSHGVNIGTDRRPAALLDFRCLET